MRPATRLRQAMSRAIREGQTPGVVVLVGKGDDVLFHEAVGERMAVPDHRPMELDTVFDLASLTKPVATATVVMQLIERGVLGLRDPVRQWLPEYTGSGRDHTTLWHLLTHCSGLPAYKQYADALGPRVPRARRRPEVVADICRLPLQHAPGKGFIYSCLGYILLASVVERATGQPLDRCFRDQVARPLGLYDTMFCPSPARVARCAATEQLPSGVLLGVVHDENARYLNGVGGNAGLFSTAPDLSRFMRMLLGGGMLGGVRILERRTVKAMLSPQLRLPGCVRGLGWDVDSDYSPSLRGDRFPKGASIGHSGYTGTSIWADPAQRLYVIILTNRVHYGRDKDVQKLRRQVADAAWELALD
ncbi:MAG: beta-lactamase family protein [Armatimonadetes bacterium]|nr:beta-lactamase family protein [Armatimonadota bacterium]